jgi:hypothetical protein
LAEGAQISLISLTRSEIKAWIAVTGLTLSVGYELAGKRVELLKDIKPDLARLAVLKNPAHPSTSLYLSEAQKAAKVLGLAAKTFDAGSLAVRCNG